MNKYCKSESAIAKMRAAGQLAAKVLTMIAPFVKPGVTTLEIDRLCHDYIIDDLQARPSTLNHQGFPASICTSINHVICHGIPNERRLK